DELFAGTLFYQKKNSSQFQLRAATALSFDMFQLSLFNMTVLTMYIKVSVTINKIAGHEVIIIEPIDKTLSPELVNRCSSHKECLAYWNIASRYTCQS
ncbi:8560_t:CDS:2, partial [Diversispora eburnea]